jgi:hypothetical protein
MRIYKQLIALFLFLLLTSYPLFAQKKQIGESDYRNYEVEMADKLREDGNIYAVVAVLTIILLVLIAYTISIDKKISNLEKFVHSENSKNK